MTQLTDLQRRLMEAVRRAAMLAAIMDLRDNDDVRIWGEMGKALGRINSLDIDAIAKEALEVERD